MGFSSKYLRCFKVFGWIIISSFLACSNEQNNSYELKLINQFNKLTLRHDDDNCGEWGGNIETIIIYRKTEDGDLLADYLKLVKYCEKPDSISRILAKNQVVITNKEQKLVLESIHQLINEKLQRMDVPPSFGYYNEVSLSGSALEVKDIPSIKWTKFEELRESILKR
ncbi:hypothetical protein Solca_0759 [Solitalea canadensis DSM 3403]|uniref:Lipoprotein n=1 Tax=Solitalea canadensis (strain ATCC 29591 / DSM 3403 / JCM 21819 / LMG 8368 / NBRC 15130 / NCIMB 12057 / USAM 9D) TaxID=929556 RepID=H8KPI0_SOLCM|nr:hypothetical protein Solca_0759 [Solitalea canadensis DSM 3403]